MTSNERDDDFAGMLRRVREASGTAPADPHAPRVKSEPPPPKKQEAPPMVSTGGLIAIAVIVVLGLVGIASLSTWIARRMVAQGAAFDNPSVRRRQLQLLRLKRYTVSTDTTISPSEAGRLLHAVGRAGFTGELRRWEREPDPKFDSACCAIPTRQAIGVFDARGNWIAAAFPAARRGLKPEERATLRAFARNGSLDAFRRVSHAPAADLGAVWSVPEDSSVTWPELPTLRVAGLRLASSANIAAAALDLAEGRLANAESRLREVISVGFLVQENARSTFDEGTALTLLSAGRTGLASFYAAVGRTADAEFASQKADPPIPISNANRRVRVDDLEETLLRRIRDTTELAGVRWALALGAFSFLPCTSVRQAVFGPSAKYRRALEEFRASHVKFPSDERRMTMTVRGIPQMIDPFTNFRQRNTERPAWASSAYSVTRSRQLERCATLFRR